MMGGGIGPVGGQMTGPGCDEPDPIPSCMGVNFTACTPQTGTNGATRLIGTVVTPDTVLCNGEVLIDKATGLIECVGESCADHPRAADATVLCADIITPGIIDPHNHMSYNTLPPWQHERQFRNRGQWRGPLAREMYDARLRSDKIAARYNELRLILSGTTAFTAEGLIHRLTTYATSIAVQMQTVLATRTPRSKNVWIHWGIAVLTHRIIARIAIYLPECTWHTSPKVSMMRPNRNLMNSQRKVS